MGEESRPAAKKCPFPSPKKFPSPIQASFIAVVIAFLIIFLTSSFMYRYIMLILISRGLLNLICIMAKGLNDQSSSKQNSQTPSPPFNAIWKILLQLLFVLTLLLNVTHHQTIESSPFLLRLTPSLP